MWHALATEDKKMLVIIGDDVFLWIARRKEREEKMKRLHKNILSKTLL